MSTITNTDAAAVFGKIIGLSFGGLANTTPEAREKMRSVLRTIAADCKRCSKAYLIGRASRQMRAS
jgi:hypothetical protein